ncbi:MAG: DHH family phosphoesterase [archaeon]
MIDLIKPAFIAGHEIRFSDFISKLGKEKIAIVSHRVDLDGITAAKVVNKVVNADEIIFLDYEDINLELVERLEKGKFKKVIFTDLNFSKPEVLKKIEKFAEVLVIDHHTFAEDLNSERTVFMNSQGFCAAYIAYYLFSKIQNLEDLDWVVACASISDVMYKNNAKWIGNVCQKYDGFFRINQKGMVESSLEELQYNINLAILYFNHVRKPQIALNSIGERYGDIGGLMKYADMVRKEVENTKIMFVKQKEKIGEFTYWKIKKMKYSIVSFLINDISFSQRDRTFIFLEKQSEICKVSARRQDWKLDLPSLLKSLIIGFENSSAGGHIPASGASFPVSYLAEFEKRLKAVSLDKFIVK